MLGNVFPCYWQFCSELMVMTMMMTTIMMMVMIMMMVAIMMMVMILLQGDMVDVHP